MEDSRLQRKIPEEEMGGEVRPRGFSTNGIRKIVRGRIVHCVENWIYEGRRRGVFLPSRSSETGNILD